MELVIRQSERSGYQQRLLQAFTEDVFILFYLVNSDSQHVQTILSFFFFGTDLSLFLPAWSA